MIFNSKTKITTLILTIFFLIVIGMTNVFAIDSSKPNTPTIVSFAPSKIEPLALSLKINSNNTGNNYYIHVINITLNRKDNYIPKFPLVYQKLINNKEYKVIAQVCKKINNEYKCSDYTNSYKATATDNNNVNPNPNVNPAVPVLSSIKSNSIGEATLNYKTSTNVTGVEILNITTNTKTTTTNKSSYTFKNLSQGKTYKFRIRTYLNKNGTTLYSNYTNEKSVTVKKLAIKTPSITSLSSPSSTSIRINYNKDKGGNVQIHNITLNKYVKTSNANYYIYNGLRQSKKYEFEIRGYTTINGKTYYTSWSKKKSLSKISYKTEIANKVKKLTSYSKSKVRITKVYNTNNVKRIATLKKETNYRNLQAFCYDGTNYLVQYKRKDDEADKYGGKIKVYSKTGKLIKSSSIYKDLGHPNGMTCHKTTAKIYSANRGAKTTVPSAKYGKKLMVINKKTLKKEKFITLSDYINAIAYDDLNELYYGTYGRVRLMVYDKNMKKKKSYKINLKSNYDHTQDSGAYHGVLFQVYIKASKNNTNYIQLYRMSDGAYLGTYRLNIANTELESVIVDNGYLVFLVNHRGAGKHYIYKSTSKIAIP